MTIVMFPLSIIRYKQRKIAKKMVWIAPNLENPSGRNSVTEKLAWLTRSLRLTYRK